MNHKKERERIFGIKFLELLRAAYGRHLSDCVFNDKPDAVCRDAKTGISVGIEITELLAKEQGCDRSWSAKAKKMISEVLSKYSSGGIVSIGFGATIPEDDRKLAEVGGALDAEIKERGGLEALSEHIRLNADWKHHLWDINNETELAKAGNRMFQKFVISEITIIPESKGWLGLTDAPVEYQAQELDRDLLLDKIKEKASKAEDYRKTDELILLLRNPNKYWEPDEDTKLAIGRIKGPHISSVWLLNRRVDTIPAEPKLVRLDG